MRGLVIALAIVTSTLAVLFGPGGPDGALAKCPPPGPNRANTELHYHDGWDRYIGAPVGGAYAKIRNQPVWVEPGNNANGEIRFSVAYSMIRRGRGELYWAQVGWDERASDVRYTFVEEIHPGTPPYQRFFTAEPINAVTYYTVLYSSTPFPGRFTFYAAGNQKGPSLTAYWTPTAGEISGEINILSNQMPGGYSYPMYFQDSSIYYSGAWRPFDGTGYADNFPFPYFRLDAWTLAIYDPWCPD